MLHVLTCMINFVTDRLHFIMQMVVGEYCQFLVSLEACMQQLGILLGVHILRAAYANMDD